MISFPLPPKVIKKDDNQAIFEIHGLYPGYGVTIGNTLRRVLLSSLEGVAVTEVKIKGVPHEFSTIPGVLEDTIMIILNLKNLRFKIHEGNSQKVELKVSGEKKVKGSDFKMFPQIELANPDLHLATITDKKTELNIEITIEKGIGYEPKDYRKIKKSEIGSIALDAIFTPIKNVNFHVENMRVGERTDFDKLSLEIQTDGTITPEEAFYRACEIILKHFNIIIEGKTAELPKADKESSGGDVVITAIEDLKLSTRTENALLENSVKTIAGLVKKSEKSLAELEGMGDKAISEIKKKLKKLGLSLKSEE
ncbi:MAG: DNA-directed RNA polymerase subunit alpha [Candidatus Staskawiczbacteria bacterium RIFCSPLOWO2_01_FULL_40_39]|uniref:DNA-directed RNA polymerase subunit alpha n=1 Tax=Candidatus Staskawiczbacteria bacterium RIFCSPHIGHO2_01_FULL_39_25 TaxID=1802202 RepID=A0A1G2HQL5_9BACT|nr:MAG: DNA-directed RNA polymerase subunit alpha [Candidatus Staskawiczbacteria bacterium RIFCSPHIGHO2_01_FULL_39_25]OGZ72677.1 MAG: DNA-directed RNA polymerase subunit alpha [Candidatus Staskawiczbacteria bacterium RIFCSPLOWO2_01_FULL_40_39]